MPKQNIEAVNISAMTAEQRDAALALHYAPCHTDPANGFKVLVALPKGTNTDKPNMPIKGGDDAYLWACNKWLRAHPDSAEAAQGAVAALTGENIDIEKDL